MPLLDTQGVIARRADGLLHLFFLPTIARPAGILNLARQRVSARTPWLSPVPLVTYSLLRAA
jgi:hypothetical protein